MLYYKNIVRGLIRSLLLLKVNNATRHHLTALIIFLIQMKTTPKEKMIINLMEEVINILSTCEDLSDPEFSMYETMKHAVYTEVYYPLFDK